MEKIAQSAIKFFTTPYGLLLVGVALITLWFTTAMKDSFIQGFANPGSYQFVMYYAPWCPHCKTVMPDFDGLGATQTIGGSTVKVSKVDCDAQPEVGKAKGVTGYPTFQLQDAQGNLVEEMGGAYPRDQGGFVNFLQSKLS